MNNVNAVDFVLTWVDGADSTWQEKKAKYTGVRPQEGNGDVRYRDWDTLRYWFRGVEKFAPWARYIFFVTDGQKPDWLNIDHPRLKWIKHTDYIPAEYLPTFSSHPIEWNLHRIKGLSEQFVYFNDDVFLINDTVQEDFFVKGLPCDMPNVGVLYPNGFFSHILFNNTELLNRHFSLKDSIRHNLPKWLSKQSLGGLFKLIFYGRKDMIPHSNSWHIHACCLKKTFEVLWECEGDIIRKTCENKLRSADDVSAYCVRDFQLFSGAFYPKKPIGKHFHTADMSRSDEVMHYLAKQKGKIICLNDTEDESNFDKHKEIIIGVFEQLFPDKSSFEL